MQLGPFRTITVRDTVSDLLRSRMELRHDGEPQSRFQRQLRGSQYQPVLRDPIRKDVSALVAARMRHTPLAPGSDWPDLPNPRCGSPRAPRPGGCGTRTTTRETAAAAPGLSAGSAPAWKRAKPVTRRLDGSTPSPPMLAPHREQAQEWDGFFGATVTNPERAGVRPFPGLPGHLPAAGQHPR